MVSFHNSYPDSYHRYAVNVYLCSSPRAHVVAASFALRVYAVMGLSRWGLIWAICLVVVGLSSIALDIVSRSPPSRFVTITYVN